MRLKPVRDQVAVIVGASSGIGRETALQFAKHGGRLIVTGRDEDALRTLVERIRADGGAAHWITCDVTKFAEVAEVAAHAVRLYGRLDTWIHLAAVSSWATFEQTSPDEFSRIIDVNLTGQAYGAMAALPHIRRTGGGALIHVSSGEAKLPLPLQSAYAASKHGMAGFLDVLRLELRHEGAPISVTNIMPSGINTPLFDKALTKIGVKPRPYPPMYQPGLVADAILHAAAHPTAEIVVGGAAKAAIAARRLVPRLVDTVVLRTGFVLQRTNIPKSEHSPHNLFASLKGFDRTEGDFGDEARSWSVWTWLATHPNTRRTFAIAALAVASVGVLRAKRTSARFCER